ncbi:MAG: hemolysin family protein [Candidatus Marinimicrobia bacterium]|nr:hemolysin family protein [Candidatus Neomarinimicrobiota bacterium]
MEFLVLGLLFILNGFFALSEIALVSSKKTRLEQAKLAGSKGAGIALRLRENSENFLSAIQLGITLIGIVTGVYGGVNIADNVTPFFNKFEITRAYSHEIALTLTVILITFVSIIIGELVPKTIALSNPEKIAKKVAPIISYFSTLCYPLVKVLAFTTNLVNDFFGIKKQPEHLTESELRQMIKIASHEGVIEKEQNLIHEKVFYFADKKAKHIMTHRTDVEWFDLNEPPEEVHRRILESRHSKIICCREDLDHFTGILMIKDYLLALNVGEKFDIQKLLIQPLVIPENADAQKVLNLFKLKQPHFCIVVDEFGGFEGIITLYDIMENILGEIPDEGELYEPDVFVRDDKSILVSGDAPVETLAEIIEGLTIDFDQIDYSSVAGFVLSNINKIPQVGDKFNFAGYVIEIVDIDGNRIDKILIRKKTET